MKGNADIYLVGIGFGPLRQLTADGMLALRNGRIVYHLTRYHEELKKLNENTVSLDDVYWTGEVVTVVYERLFRLFIAEIKRGKRVVSVVEGHPLFYDDCHARIVRWCKRNRKTCIVVPGVSCLDAISCDLEVDFGVAGLQVFEASTLVELEQTMNPTVHTLLMQAGEFGTDVTPDAVLEIKGMFLPLVSYLTRFYPANHRAIVCRTEHRGFKKIKFTTRIDRIDHHRKVICNGTTLYIPPLDS